MKLFIVESPNKCSKLKKILGSDFQIIASAGHILDMPRKGVNIDIQNNFEPNYKVMDGKQKIIDKIRKNASEAEIIYLATDPDREGEAISQHIYDKIKKKDQNKCVRVTFNEITKKAVLKSLENYRDINGNLVNAQKARQVLDRLIGYQISPLLWTSVASKTSAGRVQSAALKIICEREKEILNFKPDTYWYIDADLKAKDGQFTARVITKNKDNRYKKEKTVNEDKEKLEEANYKVLKIEKKEKKVKPYPPFDTASLQTACSSVFKWPVKKTASLSQKLYEESMITYIRSDSYAISSEASDKARDIIKENTGDKYLPKKKRTYKKKSSSSQEAHECIRPTDAKNAGNNLTGDEQKLYKLIRQRFVACQMTDAVYDTVSCTIEASSGHKLIATGQTMKFDGWTKVYQYYKSKDNLLPSMKKDEVLKMLKIKPSKHETKPPSRYNEGSLIKKMEGEGIGRPSTYPSIMESVKKRQYVETGKHSKGSLSPTDLGMKIYDYLQGNFDDFIMDLNFTSALEKDLDVIESGEKKYKEVVGGTYDILNKKTGQLSSAQTTGIKCKVCKKGEIIQKSGKYGNFYACDQYPDCKTIYDKNEDGSFTPKANNKGKSQKTAKTTKYDCPECKKSKREGKLVERNSKHGKFLGCENYPKCKCLCVIENDVLVQKK